MNASESSEGFFGLSIGRAGMTSHSRCVKDSALCDTKFCLLREHRVLADVLLKNFVAAYQSLRDACAILGFLSQRILNEGSNWTQKKKSNVFANY